VVVMPVGVQEPSFRSAPKYKVSKGREAIEIAASVGLDLDPWQQMALEIGGGCKPDGKWAAFEVGGMVSRQNGKGGILEARELAGLFCWGERLIIHSSHEFATSMEAFLRMEELLEGSADLSRQIKSISRSHGSEGYVLKTGQRLRYRTRTKGGGRGFTGDTLMLDEAMDLPEMFHGALLPTLSGRSIEGNPQVWYMGSAVDQLVHEHGIVFARVRERGLTGKDPSLAYFEYSVDRREKGDPLPFTPDRVSDELLGDEEAWAEANPGLGIRISASHIAKELRSMDSRTFAVERLGVGDWPATDGSSQAVIDLETWKALTDTDSVITGSVCFAFDVTPDRSASSICVAGKRDDGLEHVEVVDHRRGTGWVVPRLVELQAAHEPSAFVCDGKGPAGSLIRELEEFGIEPVTVTANEHANACGLLFDLVEQDGLRHLGTVELTAAVKGAAKRPLGDAWAWSRRSSVVDISPLVGCTLSLWASANNAGEILSPADLVGAGW
jgi:hypothetical protein